MSEATTTLAAPIEAVIRRVLGVYRRWGRDTTVGQMRADWDALFGSVAVDAIVEPVAMGALSGEWITAPGADTRRVVLYFHGGGFQVGSSRSHRELMAGISAAGACRVLGLDYRLAPEHRYPGALEDACTAYDWLVAQGNDPSNIVLAGDSAGGNLALAALLRLREAGRTLPAGAVLMSAWTDMTASGESYVTRAQSDPIHQRPMILAMARNYLGPEGDARDPLVSPLLADLAGLPPMLIQVGERETVLDDSLAFAAKARAAGIGVELEVWEGMIHVFQQFPAELPEARDALASIGRFLSRRWA
ncbi:MAG: alpha/beta hydrolase [Variovorax sp.]